MGGHSPEEVQVPVDLRSRIRDGSGGQGSVAFHFKHICVIFHHEEASV